VALTGHRPKRLRGEGGAQVVKTIRGTQVHLGQVVVLLAEPALLSLAWERMSLADMPGDTGHAHHGVDNRQPRGYGNGW
jgi:hypothetical protein